MELNPDSPLSKQCDLEQGISVRLFHHLEDERKIMLAFYTAYLKITPYQRR